MIKRSILFLLLIVSAHATIQAQESSRPADLRILVEGEPSASRGMVEALRRSTSAFDFKFQFVSKLADRHDVRLFVTPGKGDASCFAMTDSCSAQFFYFTAVALAPDGKMLFTAAESGSAPKQALDTLAAGVLRNLYAQSRNVKRSGADAAHDPASSESSATSIQGLPAEPGVYHKEDNAWIMFKEGFASGVKNKGVGKAMLTFGMAEIRITNVYDGAQASAQLSERKPVFYVRGFGISEGEAYIARVEKKKDQREIQIAAIAGFNPRAGYRESDLFQATVERIAEDLYKITPASELEPGEYLLGLSQSGFEGVYEFGIARVKK